jgi:hypothetical protein
MVRAERIVWKSPKRIHTVLMTHLLLLYSACTRRQTSTGSKVRLVLGSEMLDLHLFLRFSWLYGPSHSMHQMPHNWTPMVSRCLLESGENEQLRSAGKLWNLLYQNKELTLFESGGRNPAKSNRFWAFWSPYICDYTDNNLRISWTQGRYSGWYSIGALG